MLKIVKSKVYNLDYSKPVALGKPEPAPAPVKETESEPAPEDIARSEAENARLRAEEEKKRFNEAVIKRSDELVRAHKEKMKAEYDRLISSGNAHAERLIEDAKSKTRAVFAATDEECARLKEKSRMEGFEAGFEAGKAEAMKECSKYLDAAAKLISEINSHKEAYYVSNEAQLCDTVMDMVKKIVLAEIKTDPAVIDRICVNAAKSFRNSDYLKISLAKGEASAKFVCDKDFVKGLIPFIPEIEIEELDPQDVPAGTVVLDNGTEIIDASIPTQLEFLREIVRGSQSENDKN